MSYSFSIQYATKEGAIAGVVTELNKVVANQPEHAKDVPAVKEAAKTFINRLADPGDKDEVRVVMHGSLGWRADRSIYSANVSISCGISQGDPVTAR
jgi:hypothetical protein